MISAKEAKFESEYRAKITEILNDCNNKILEATKKGKFECEVAIWISGTSEEVYTEVQEELKSLGYETHLTNDRITTKNAPCDQCAYWEYLTIKW